MDPSANCETGIDRASRTAAAMPSHIHRANLANFRSRGITHREFTITDPAGISDLGATEGGAVPSSKFARWGELMNPALEKEVARSQRLRISEVPARSSDT